MLIYDYMYLVLNSSHSERPMPGPQYEAFCADGVALPLARRNGNCLFALDTALAHGSSSSSSDSSSMRLVLPRFFPRRLIFFIFIGGLFRSASRCFSIAWGALAIRSVCSGFRGRFDSDTIDPSDSAFSYPMSPESVSR